ncbi:MAG: TonB-dependent receptor [Bacteroidales bacterium]|nr:TonB-dependent receptor [Bacteroidales bacterium]
MRNLIVIVLVALQVNFVLAQSPGTDTITMKEVVVTGTRVEVAKENIPLTVSVITAEEIQQDNETSILPVIGKKVPGMFVTERGVTGFGVSEGSAGQINIRGVGGFPNNQVLVLIDGAPQFMGIFGHPLPDNYVASDIEKVEVIRGPASILYGTNAMGGVINLITRKQHYNGWRANARAMYGSFNTRKYMANGGYKNDKLELFASVNRSGTDGHRDSAAFNITNGYLKGRYTLSNHVDVTADINLSTAESHDPGRVGTDAGYVLDMDRGKASVAIENNFTNMDGAVRFYHNFGEHFISDGFHSIDHMTGIMAHESFSLFSGNTLTVGAEYKNYGGRAENELAMNGEGMTFGDTTLNEFGSYAFLQQAVGNSLMLNGGLRLENNSVFGSELIPQFGFAWHPGGEMTVKGSYSKGFRSPTMRELYLFPPANEDLEPERMNNIELGVSRDLFDNKINVGLTGFYSQGNNLIAVLGQFPNVRNENTGEFTHYGLEFDFSYTISSKFNLDGNYAYTHTDEPRIATPEHQAYVSSTYRSGRWSFNLEIEHISNLVTYANYRQLGLDAVPVESYTLLNAKASYRMNRYLKFFLKGENLIDEDYMINYGYPMPGVTVFGGVNVQLATAK